MNATSCKLQDQNTSGAETYVQPTKLPSFTEAATMVLISATIALGTAKRALTRTTIGNGNDECDWRGAWSVEAGVLDTRCTANTSLPAAAALPRSRGDSDLGLHERRRACAGATSSPQASCGVFDTWGGAGLRVLGGCVFMQHFLNFFPDPHPHRSFGLPLAILPILAGAVVEGPREGGIHVPCALACARRRKHGKRHCGHH